MKRRNWWSLARALTCIVVLAPMLASCGGDDAEHVVDAATDLDSAGDRDAASDADAGDDAVTILEDAAPTLIDVTSDSDGGLVTVMSFTQPAHGTVVAATNGLTYTVEPNYNGPDAFTYTLDDGSVRTVNITVTPVNDAPSFTAGADQGVLEDAGAQTLVGWAATPSTGPANESTQVLDFLVTNDNNALFSTQPAISTTGQLTYTPAANANGMATVTVRIHDDGGTANTGVDTSAPQTFTITVGSVNDAPSFAAGANQTVSEDAGAQSIGWATAVSAGPSNESTQTVSFAVNATNGTLFSVAPAIAANGTLTYTPAANANGSSTVTVTLSDNGGTANGGSSTSASQMFTITVTPVNDAPTTTADTLGPIAEDSGVFTIAFSSLTGNDSAGPANESTQTLSVTAVASGTGGTVAIVNGAVELTPAANFFGTATFTYTVQDNGTTNGVSDPKSGNGSVSITVTSVNDVPVASSNSTTTVEDTAVTIDVLANDTGLGDGGLVVQVVSGPSHGTATVDVNNRIVYTPGLNITSAASLTYRVTDANGDMSSSSVSVSITPVNDPPTANADFATTTVNKQVAVNVLTNDTDPEGDTITLVSFTQPAHGSVAVNPGVPGQLVYTPTANYCDAVNGDSFTYQINGGSSATVQISFTNCN